jgi:hypothetical protein
VKTPCPPSSRAFSIGPEAARTVTPSRSRDGPYSETKEVLGGYWLIEASDYDEAMEVVADHPHLRFGSLEVREIQEMTAP